MRKLRAIAVIALTALFTPTAEAAVLRSLQTNTITQTVAVQNIAITNVDTTKTFVLCHNLTNSSNPSNRVTCELTAATNLRISSGAANASETVRWWVVEFASGVSVQRGLQAIAAGAATQNVALGTAVDLARTFVLTSENTASTSQIIDEEWTMRAQLTTTTNLQLTRNETGIVLNIAWQVVQIDAAFVQSGLTSILSGAASNTATIYPVDPARTFLVLSYRGAVAADGAEDNYMVNGTVTNSTTLTFSRQGTPANAVNVAWFAVTMVDGTAVQRGTVVSGVGPATLNVPITAVDLTRTVPFISASGGGGGATADLDSTSWTTQFTTTTNLQLARFNVATTTGTTSTVAWFVVQFSNTENSARVSRREQYP